MRSQGNLKSEMLQSYNIQSSYQPKSSQINVQKNSRNSQNRSSHMVYPSMMSPSSNTYGYNQISKNTDSLQPQQQSYMIPSSISTSITPTGKSLSLTTTNPLQYNKLANSIDSSATPTHHSNQGLTPGGSSNTFAYSKPSYGYGNYNTIDHTSTGNISESNYLYNGYRSQTKKLSNTGQIVNQSASSIVGYGGLTNSTQNVTPSQQQIQQQQVNKQNPYTLSENNQLQLPKLQSSHEGILATRQMNGSISEKASLRSPVIEFDNTANSGQRKQEQPSKNNLRNIVKYYNNQGQNLANPYSTPLQQQTTGSSAENQQQQQLVSLGTGLQGRQSNTTSAVGSSHNLKESQAVNGAAPSQNGNNTINSQNSTQNYYSLQSARPPSNSNIKKDLTINNQYSQYSSLGKNLNYLNSPSSAQASKLQSQQQSILSPNNKSTRIQSNDSSQKTPLKAIQPSSVTGYNSIFNQNSSNQQVQFNAKQAMQNTIINNDLLDIRMLPKIDKSKISTKQIGLVHAYGANTHQGLIRGYNEDRVSIILNMVKPQEKSHLSDWPNISFFAIYDGHGGAQCADFLRDQLHFYIIKDEEFPKNPQKAIHNGFVKAEDAFLKLADSQIPLDKSGSCAIVVMLINEQIYVANLGDSRAVLSQNCGTKVVGLTVDHKPNYPDEEKRIIMNGGKIYQSQIPTLQPKQYPQFVKGPHRVLPGRLAVSRTIGDAEAKLKKYGGNSKVISCEPEITSLTLSPEHDYIMLGCDGIFDKLTNNQSIDFIWDSMKESFKKKETRQSLHDYVGDGIEYLIKQTLIHKSFDNLTVVIICFKNLERLLLS